MDFVNMIEKTKFWSKPVAIMVYLYKNMQPDTGYVFATYKKIQDATGATSPTVAKVMTQMQEDGVIKKVQNGVWQFCL